jgi:hypothetical protein
MAGLKSFMGAHGSSPERGRRSGRRGGAGGAALEGQLGGRHGGGATAGGPWGHCPVATLLAISCILVYGCACVREQETGGRRRREEKKKKKKKKKI